MIVKTARPADLRFILQMQRAESNALGFVPRARLEWEIARSRVLVAYEGRMKLGYTYMGSTASGVLPIYQCVTEAGVRRRAIGQAFIAACQQVASSGGAWGLECHCREELEANAFWQAMGFQCTYTRPGGAGRGRMLHTYERSIR